MQTEIAALSLHSKMNTLARLVMGFILLSLAFRLAQYALPFQFLSPPLYGLGLEIPFRLFKFLALDKILIESPAGSAIFSFTLFAVAIICFRYPQTNFFWIAFSLIFFLYFICYDMTAISHLHPLSAIVWITVPFWAKRPGSRWLLWEGMRYYACFIYAASFIYKIIGGSLFFWENGVNSVKWNVAEYMYQNPGSITSEILSYSIGHPLILNAGHLVVMLAEGLMIVGFFTKKFDRYLVWVPVLVHLSTYLYSDVFFLEMLILVFLFFNDKQIAWLQKEIPVLLK